MTYEELYRTSPIRANLIRWLPFSGNERVLLIGETCQAIEELLRERAAGVTVIPAERLADVSSRKGEQVPAEKREQVPAEKSAALPAGSFDLICAPDGLEACLSDEDAERLSDGNAKNHPAENTESHTGDDIPTPYVNLIRRLLDLAAPGGKVLIGAANRLGLKYFAGSREPCTGEFFHGIEGYAKTDRKRTFSRKEWMELTEAAGCSERRFYYPFPDHIFPMQIFSDAYLPRREELIMRSLNFAEDRMTLFDDERVMQSLLDNDLFPEFANSFLIEIRP